VCVCVCVCVSGKCLDLLSYILVHTSHTHSQTHTPTQGKRKHETVCVVLNNDDTEDVKVRMNKVWCCSVVL
jgi:hypothetical protein